MPPLAATPILSAPDRLAAVYQLKIHLLGISPHIYRLVRGDTIGEHQKVWGSRFHQLLAHHVEP